VVTYFVSAWLQKIITQPILHLADTAKAVSAEKNYSVRAVKRSEDELGQLMDSFNEMLTQIRERDAALRQAHDKLEKRVEERTRDLQLEITERERAQEALQQQVGRISLLNQITQVISERQDLASILQVVLRQLEERAPVDMGGVFLLEPQSDTLAVAAMRRESQPGPANSTCRQGRCSRWKRAA
jgi:nitrate/nitrite-specific signal transduction histidine kinase